MKVRISFNAKVIFANLLKFKCCFFDHLKYGNSLFRENWASHMVKKIEHKGGKCMYPWATSASAFQYLQQHILHLHTQKVILIFWVTIVQVLCIPEGINTSTNMIYFKHNVLLNSI